MKNYEAPTLEVTKLENEDIVTTSKGDSPMGDYEW